MDRLSEFDHTAFYALGAIGDQDLRRHVERGRRLQRAALRRAFRTGARGLVHVFSGWGEARLGHPRSRMGY